MREPKLIYRNLQHTPKLYGITFPKVIYTLVASLVLMMFGNTTFGWKIGVPLLFVGLLAGYGICYFLDSQDTLGKDQGRFVRDEVTSYTHSGQSIKIK